MREFGSDFHLIEKYSITERTLQEIYPNAVFFANGRQCIITLIKQNKWKRVWIPEYFCYEVINSIAGNGIQILYYTDSPYSDDIYNISNLKFEKGDVLLRTNYFGLRNFRDEKFIPVPIIEDHTHDLLGRWALNSNADWCIASLRKSLPIPEGGMLWSPKGHKIEKFPMRTLENDELAKNRWHAMKQKTRYLQGDNISKDEFRSLYIDTEKSLSMLSLSLMDSYSINYLNSFDISAWYARKKNNWKYLIEMLSCKQSILRPESEDCYPFSLVFFTNSKEERDQIRKKLIQANIYPAILWDIPQYVSRLINGFSDRMLSIHCDGRYAESEICELGNKLNKILQ